MTNHQHHHHSAAGPREPALAEMLDLDAEVLHAYRSDLTAWLDGFTDGRPPRRILDLGCGTGTGTFALLARFGEATATAVDVSAHMLHHLRGTACALGVDARIHTVQVDLDAAWPVLGTADLAWAASSLHHVADADHFADEVLKALRPGGLLAVTEMDSYPRFLPDDLGLGRPGLEARIHAARDTELNRGRDSDPTPSLLRAGFTLEAKRTFTIDVRHPLPTATARYAQVSLHRLRAHLDDRLDADDLAALDTLIDTDAADGVLRRRDLTVRTSRTTWLARRP